MAAQVGAPGAPPFAFVAKNAPVSWESVFSFDVERLLNGREVTPTDLNALDEMAGRLEQARIEPDPGVAPEENAARLARLATILQLSSEYQAMRAEVRLVTVERDTTVWHFFLFSNFIFFLPPTVFFNPTPHTPTLSSLRLCTPWCWWLGERDSSGKGQPHTSSGTS